MAGMRVARKHALVLRLLLVLLGSVVLTVSAAVSEAAAAAAAGPVVVGEDGDRADDEPLWHQVAARLGLQEQPLGNWFKNSWESDVVVMTRSTS